MMHTLTLTFRVTTLNLEQNHNRWNARRALVIDQRATLQPDLMAVTRSASPCRPGGGFSVWRVNG